MNLIANAKDATEGQKERKISIALNNDADFFYISLKDNGKGIPEEIQEKIFDPFFTTKDVNKGTGIGLSLSNNFINELNGELKVSSKVGEGAIFHIKIPIHKEIEQEIKPAKNSTDQLSKFSQNVLLVDDEEGIRDLLSEYLNEFGLQVTKAVNGEEALKIYTENP